MDEQLALLVSITCLDLETCRVALVRAGGDLNLAAQRLTSDGAEGTRGRCAECGAEGEGYYGEGSYSETFFCGSCWSQWGRNGLGVDAMLVDHSEQENMLHRDLGLLKAGTLEELGALLAEKTAWKLSQNWNTSLQRTGEYFAWNAAGRSTWAKMATGAAAAMAKAKGVQTAAKFLAGAAREVGSDQLWKLLTIYEIQVASQLPRRQNRDAKAVGCTGVACASSSLLGQTEEVDVYIYDYGKLDVVFRLGFTSALPALLYDPGCTMCPIGIGASGLCVSRFTLYPNSGAAEPSFAGLPLTVILWELMLGPRNLPEAVEFLKGLYVESPPMAGAAMLLMQPGHGAAMVEWSPKQISVSPAAEGVLVHANHCILDSWMNKDLRDAESPKIAKLLEESKRRQAAVESRYAEDSFGLVQNDDVLATVISCPRERALYVRFRLQIRGMERVEDTVACDFWQLFFENLHKYKAIPADLALLGRAKTAADQLRSLQRVYSQSLKGVQLANAVAQELEDWSRVAAPELQKLDAAGEAKAPVVEEKPPKELSKKEKKKLKKERKREKKARKDAKKAEKALAKIEKAAQEAERVAKRSNEEEAEAAKQIAEITAELEAAEAAALEAEQSSEEDPEMVAKTERLRAQLNEAYEMSAQAALAAAEKAEAVVASVSRKRKKSSSS
eukprot:s2745_g1.t1